MNNNRKMVYRGRKDRVHIADGERRAMGRGMALNLDAAMRSAAYRDNERQYGELFGADAQPLCPGCYMVALFNAAVYLAKRNGQSLTELGNSLAGAFAELAAGGPTEIEEIRVVQDAGRPYGYAPPMFDYRAPEMEGMA